MPELSSQWAKALRPDIDVWVHEGFEYHPDVNGELFRIKEDVTGGMVKLHDSWGVGLISKASENSRTPEASKQKGYESVLGVQIYKQKMSVTYEMIKRNQYSEITDNAQDLGKGAKQTLNLIGSSVLINAFNSSYTAYGDNKPLCSTGHTRPDGGTAQSNASSTGAPLTEANLETGLLALKQQKSGKGLKLNIANNNVALVVPEALDKEAIIITGSQLRSGTANNDLNWYLGKVNVFVHPFIGSDVEDLDGNSGSDTHWFLIDMNVARLVMNFETRPFFDSWEDKDTGVMYTKIYFSVVAYWENWLGIWGSKGDGNAYTG